MQQPRPVNASAITPEQVCQVVDRLHSITLACLELGISPYLVQRLYQQGQRERLMRQKFGQRSL